MKCEICGSNHAEILIQQTANGKTSELYICKNCAEAYHLYNEDNQLNISIDSVLHKIAEAAHNTEDSKILHEAVRMCPGCGTTQLHIKKTQQLGCPLCFFYFRDTVLDIIKTGTPDPLYTGTLPDTLETFANCRISLSELRSELEKAVQSERYELAAYFRDKIKEMETAL